MEKIKRGIYRSKNRRWIVSRQYDKTWVIYFQDKHIPERYETTMIYFHTLDAAKRWIAEQENKRK